MSFELEHMDAHLPHQQDFIKRTDNDRIVSKTSNKKQCSSSFWFGLLIGGLTGSIILAVILTFYITSSNENASGTDGKYMSISLSIK